MGARRCRGRRPVAGDPPDAIADRGRGRLVAPRHRPIAAQLDLEIRQGLADRVDPIDPLRLTTHGVGGRSSQVSKSLLGLAGRLHRSRDRATQLRSPPVKGQGLRRVSLRERRESERHCLESDRLCQPRPLAPDSPIERDRVAAGGHHRSDRFAAEGVARRGVEVDRVGRRVAQIPRHSVRAAAAGTGQASQHLAFGIPHRENDRRLLLAIFPAKLLPARVADRLTVLLRLLLGRLALLFERLEILLQIVGEDRSEGGIRGRVESVTLERLVVVAELEGLDEHLGVPHREQDRFRLECLLAETTQRGVVIEHVEAPSECPEHEVVLAALDLEIAHRDRRHAARELDPAATLVASEGDSELGPHEEQLRLFLVLGDRVDRPLLRQVPGDRLPRPAAIATLRDIGLEIAVLVSVEGGVDGVRIVQRSHEVRDVGPVGDALDAVFAAPALAAILGHLDQPVVGADVDQTLGEGRFVDRDDVAEERGRPVLGDRVDTPHLVHHLEGVAVDVAGQVVAHADPAVASIVATVETL